MSFETFPGCPVRGGGAPAGSLAWRAVLDLDLTGAADQSLGAAGSYANLGYTWWAKGPAQGTTTTAFIAGTGLRYNNPDDAALTTRWQSFATYNQRLVFFPFAQVVGWNPSLPSLVSFRIAGTLSNNSSRSVIAGTGGMEDSGTAITVTEKAASFSWDMFLPWAPGTNFVCQGTGTGNQTCSGNASGDLGDYQLGLLRPAAGACVPCGRPYAGAMEAPDAADFMGSQGNTTRGFYNAAPSGAAEQANMGAFMAMHHTSTDGFTLTFDWTNLAIFQPGV